MNILNYFPSKRPTQISNPLNGDQSLYPIENSVDLRNGDFIEFNQKGVLTLSSIYDFSNITNVIDCDCIDLTSTRACVIYTTFNNDVYETSVMIVDILSNVIIDVKAFKTISYIKKNKLNIGRITDTRLAVMYEIDSRILVRPIILNPTYDEITIGEEHYIDEQAKQVKAVKTIIGSTIMMTYISVASELVVKILTVTPNGPILGEPIVIYQDSNLTDVSICLDMDKPLLLFTTGTKELHYMYLDIDGYKLNLKPIRSLTFPNVINNFKCSKITKDSMIIVTGTDVCCNVYRVRFVINELELRNQQSISYHKVTYIKLSRVGRGLFILTSFDSTGFYFYKIDCQMTDSLSVESNDISELISLDSATNIKSCRVNHHNILIIFNDAKTSHLNGCTIGYQYSIKKSADWVDGVALENGENGETILASIPEYFSQEK